MADRPLRPATDRRLGAPLPHQLANRPQAPPPARLSSLSSPERIRRISCGISHPFEWLFPTAGQITYVLLTRPPLTDLWPPTPPALPLVSQRPVLPGLEPRFDPFDLHVLGTPPAFILSQDQTLRKNIAFSGVGYGSH